MLTRPLEAKENQMSDRNFDRRSFLRQLAAVLPAGAVFLADSAWAQDLPKLTEDDPTAKALLYVHDASAVDTANPQAANYKAGQTCANCIQIQGEEGAAWRPCGIFPGKLVANGGWCSVWAAKP